MRMMARCVLLVWLQTVLAGSAAAQCVFTITPISFGSVNVLSGSAVDVTATLNINCSGLLFAALRICPSIGAGSGGATASTRRMSGAGGSTLNYQLYQDSARTIVWGSYDWSLPGTPPTIDVLLSLGAVNTSRPIYARVFGGQSTVTPDFYQSVFSAVDTHFVYGQLGVLPCPNLLLPQHAYPVFTVSASVQPACEVDAQDINFGNHGVLSNAIDATGQVTVTCTASTSYEVGLGPGNANSTPVARELRQGSEKVVYGLYRDASRTQPWGDTAGTLLGGSGSGTQQTLPVYGRVPPQATPSPGLYTDNIVVTVTY